MENRDLKSAAKAMASYLAEQGLEVSHTRMLEALSRGIGERNWSTLSARLNTPMGRMVTSDAVWAAGGEPMTDAQFAARKGLACPYCGSRDIEADNLQADGPLVTDDVTCGGCGKEFHTHYTVSGWSTRDSRNPFTVEERAAIVREHQRGSLFFSPALVGMPDDTSRLAVAASKWDGRGKSCVVIAEDYPGSMAGFLKDPDGKARFNESVSKMAAKVDFSIPLIDLYRDLPTPVLGLAPEKNPIKPSALMTGLLARALKSDTAPAVDEASQLTQSEPKQSSASEWTPESLAAMKAFQAKLSSKDVLLFTGQGQNASNWFAAAYPAKEAVFYLWHLLESQTPESANDLVALLADQTQEVVHELFRGEVHQLTKAVRHTLAEALSVVRKTLAEYSFASTDSVRTYQVHDGVRPDVVDDLEEHVRHMARRHGFSLQGEQIVDAIQDSADQLNLDISPAEVVFVREKLSS